MAARAFGQPLAGGQKYFLGSLKKGRRSSAKEATPCCSRPGIGCPAALPEAADSGGRLDPGGGGISEDSLGGAVCRIPWERDHLWRTGPDLPD